MKKKPTIMQHEIPFRLIKPEAIDLEILNEPLVPEIAKSEYPSLIISCAEDGIGDLIVIPFSDILELGRADENHPMVEEGLYLRVRNTEGEQWWGILDFRVIHY